MQTLRSIVAIPLVFTVLLVGGYVAAPAVYAQIPVAGKIIAYYPPSPQPTANMHMFGPPYPGLGYCAFCMGPVGVGQWFMGQMVGNVMVMGALGGF